MADHGREHDFPDDASVEDDGSILSVRVAPSPSVTNAMPGSWPALSSQWRLQTPTPLTHFRNIKWLTPSGS